MIDNQDGIREKDISNFSGKRHSKKDSLKQFSGNVGSIHFDEDEGDDEDIDVYDLDSENRIYNDYISGDDLDVMYDKLRIGEL